jgi:hypothetical protein
MKRKVSIGKSQVMVSRSDLNKQCKNKLNSNILITGLVPARIHSPLKLNRERGISISSIMREKK